MAETDPFATVRMREQGRIITSIEQFGKFSRNAEAGTVIAGLAAIQRSLDMLWKQFDDPEAEILASFDANLIEEKGENGFTEFVCDQPLRYTVMARKALQDTLFIPKAEATEEAVRHQGYHEVLLTSPVIQNSDGTSSRVILGINHVDPSNIINPGYIPRQDRQQG